MGACVLPGWVPATASVPASCALGRVPNADRAIVQNALDTARIRFTRSLTGLSPARRTHAGELFATDLAAYMYGYPIVIIRRTIESFPKNRMVSIGKLADTSTVTVVAPNHDTLYSVAQLDLSGGPVVIHTPPTDHRYSVIQLLDGFTNAAAYLGDGTAAGTGETAVIVPPGWHGTLPAGLRVVHPATKLLWLLGRTLATGTADTAAAVRLLKGYTVDALTGYASGMRSPPLVLPDFPHRSPITVPVGTAFFDQLGSDLAADPPPRADACALRAFAGAGVGPGRSAAGLTGDSARALAAAAAVGKGVLSSILDGFRHQPAQVKNGWATTPPDTARYGTDYIARAVVGVVGLGANTNAKALYLTEDRDSSGRKLTGAHPYTLHFAAGTLPPVGQFWSVTLYDSRILFYPNPLNRFALGDRSAGLKRGPGGSITIIVSHRAPRASLRGNWLPAPAGAFSLYMRLYEPRPAALTGGWLPPSVVRAG